VNELPKFCKSLFVHDTGLPSRSSVIENSSLKYLEALVCHKPTPLQELQTLLDDFRLLERKWKKNQPHPQEMGALFDDACDWRGVLSKKAPR
jgi:hypothetical protein